MSWAECGAKLAELTVPSDVADAPQKSGNGKKPREIGHVLRNAMAAAVTVAVLGSVGGTVEVPVNVTVTVNYSK
jgi:hypothetical protein